MKIGWRIMLYVMAAAFALMGILVLTGVLGASAPGYDSRVEDDLFSVGMTRLDGEVAETFPLRAGDAIDVSVVHMGGELTLRIACGENMIYEGRNPKLGGFRVNIPEDGAYVITVTGRRAEGSISFRMVRADGTETEE